MLMKRYLNKHNFIWLAVELVVLLIIASPPVAKEWYLSMLFQSWVTGATNKPVQAIAGVPRENESIPTPSGNTLNGWYFKKQGSDCTILLSHGNAGSIADRVYLIDELLKCGASVFAYDYAGYGNSTGKPSLEEICVDGESAYDFLIKQLHVAPDSVVIMGESLGTGVACRIAEHHQCRSLLLQSPFYDLLRLVRKKLFWWNVYPDVIVPFMNLDNSKIVARFPKPILILYGEDDFTIPTSEPNDLYKVCTAPKCTIVEIPGRDHNSIYYPPLAQYREAISKFLSER
jgi:pimeloyl-ACP methyl ester carboxylesterase